MVLPPQMILIHTHSQSHRNPDCGVFQSMSWTFLLDPHYLVFLLILYYVYILLVWVMFASTVEQNYLIDDKSVYQPWLKSVNEC